MITGLRKHRLHLDPFSLHGGLQFGPAASRDQQAGWRLPGDQPEVAARQADRPERGGLQRVRGGPRHGAVLRGEGGAGDHAAEGSHPGVHPQERGAVPLHLRHGVPPHTGGGLRGELREELSDLIQAEGLQRDGEEMLQTRGQGLQRPGSRGVPHRV